MKILALTLLIIIKVMSKLPPLRLRTTQLWWGENHHDNNVYSRYSTAASVESSTVLPFASLRQTTILQTIHSLTSKSSARNVCVPKNNDSKIVPDVVPNIISNFIVNLITRSKAVGLQKYRTETIPKAGTADTVICFKFQ